MDNDYKDIRDAHEDRFGTAGDEWVGDDIDSYDDEFPGFAQVYN